MSEGISASTSAEAVIQAETEALVQGLRVAATAAGLQPGDPLAPLVESLALVVRHLGTQRVALAGAIDKIGDLLHQGRESAEAEAARFRAECTTIEAGVVERVSSAIAQAADSALMQRVQGEERRAGFRVALTLALAVGIGAGAGWFWADRTAEARTARVEADVRAALRAGPETAAAWADLMTWNDLGAALATCSTAGQVIMQEGRRACRVPLWVAKPPIPQP